MSDNSISGFQRWQTGRIVTSADTYTTNLGPDNFDNLTGKMIGIHPATAIALLFIGQDAADEVFGIQISGYCDPKNTGPGPGVRLYKADCTLGASTFSDIPLDDKKWGASATWLFTDTIDTTGGYNENSTQLIGTNGADRETMLLVPTLGFTHILVEIGNTSGAAFTTAKVGFMWRETIRGVGILTI